MRPMPCPLRGKLSRLDAEDATEVGGVEKLLRRFSTGENTAASGERVVISPSDSGESSR